jgi:hypothetical protein
VSLLDLTSQARGLDRDFRKPGLKSKVVEKKILMNFLTSERWARNALVFLSNWRTRPRIFYWEAH